MAQVLAFALVAMAAATALAPLGAARRAVAATLLLFAAGFVSEATPRRVRRKLGELRLTDKQIERWVQGVPSVLARFGDSFGVLVLTNATRTHAVIAFTSTHATRFVPIDCTMHEPRLLARLFEGATTMTQSDIAILGDTNVFALSVRDATQLLDEIRKRDRAAFTRVCTSAATGDSLFLDRTGLRLGAHTIDFARPFLWRAFVFQEGHAHWVGVYHATWIRQNDHEIVLVSPIPTDSSWRQELEQMDAAPAVATDEPRWQFTRELRWMQATPSQPPNRNHRFAIDAMLMLPIRQRLAQITRRPSSARLPAAEKHPSYNA